MNRKDHAKFICDVSELTSLFHDALGMEDFLQRISVMTSHHMACEVCSIYIYYPDSNELVLKATQGLNPSSIGQVKMKLGEGLTGLALKEKRPICEGSARNNPNFRFFPGIGEERYESFLAVPIVRGAIEIGVMVVQSVKRNYFTPEDIQVFRAITSQLAATIETARLLITLNDQKQEKPAVAFDDLKFIKGRCGSEGVALAEAFVIQETMTDVSRFVRPGSKYTKEDFFNAIEQTEKQLQELQANVEDTLFDVAAMIFTAQLLMLKDKGFTDAIVRHMDGGLDATAAIVLVVEEYVRKFNSITDSYLREKIYDVKDVGRRLLENLTGLKDSHSDIEGRIVIARELFPSDALKLFSQKVKGIVLLSGGVTGHVAILSRSLDIPLVVAEEMGLLNVPAGTPLLLDAVMGHVHLNPAEDTVRTVMQREELSKKVDHLKVLIRENPTTKDGTPINLMVNINLLGDLQAANEFKAHGIGLYRSEFPFLIRSNFPSEEEQYLIYRRLVTGMPGKPVTLRTLDIGGDKALSYYDYGKEENPFLGLRSIRFSLKHKDIFAAQIRAMLRAGFGANIRLMFPMISSVDEFQQAKGVVQECLHELKIEKVEHHPNPQIGIMVELPSVLEIIDDLAAEADFFSIGTNDLVQYLLGVDRTNEKVADLYVPHHPSVLRALAKIVQAARRHNKDVSICGDMAHEAKYIPFLLGIGLRSFSLDAHYLPKVHQQLSEILLPEAQALAGEVLKQRHIARTAQLLNAT